MFSLSRRNVFARSMMSDVAWCLFRTPRRYFLTARDGPGRAATTFSPPPNRPHLPLSLPVFLSLDDSRRAAGRTLAALPRIAAVLWFAWRVLGCRYARAIAYVSLARVHARARGAARLPLRMRLRTMRSPPHTTPATLMPIFFLHTTQTFSCDVRIFYRLNWWRGRRASLACCCAWPVYLCDVLPALCSNGAGVAF